MIAAVIPARNESRRIVYPLASCLAVPVDLVVPVLNGCEDDTWDWVRTFRDRRIQPVHFRAPLGIDVPRAVGAQEALGRGARVVLFVDGDLKGRIERHLRVLVGAVERGLDLALSQCLSEPPAKPGLAREVYSFREELNRRLGLLGPPGESGAGPDGGLGAASPSHGPSAVSRRFLRVIPTRELGVPPVALTLARRAGLRIGVETHLPHARLGSAPRDKKHSEMIAHTIIGDCLEAMAVWEDRPRSRAHDGREYIGYAAGRRWDLLDRFLAKKAQAGES